MPSVITNASFAKQMPKSPAALQELKLQGIKQERLLGPMVAIVFYAKMAVQILPDWPRFQNE
jgi:hypothetical protein